MTSYVSRFRSEQIGKPLPQERPGAHIGRLFLNPDGLRRRRFIGVAVRKEWRQHFPQQLTPILDMPSEQRAPAFDISAHRPLNRFSIEGPHVDRVACRHDGRQLVPLHRRDVLALEEVDAGAGAVEPAGWLRDWCLAARDGFTGHMDEYDDEFKRAWAQDHKMTGERLDWPKGGWPYEGGGYWFDGLVRLGYALHDEALIQQAKRRLEVVVTNMNSTSILFLWWLNRNSPADRNGSVVSDAWPMWANGLLGRALVGYYAGSGDKHALQTLESGYSGDRDWLRLGWAMSNPWPAFDTWTWTGNKEIAAALTKLFSADGGGAARVA